MKTTPNKYTAMAQAFNAKITKDKILEILKFHTVEMEGYAYFAGNPGIPQHDYEEIADKILKVTHEKGGAE